MIENKYYFSPRGRQELACLYIFVEFTIQEGCFAMRDKVFESDECKENSE